MKEWAIGLPYLTLTILTIKICVVSVITVKVIFIGEMQVAGGLRYFDELICSVLMYMRSDWFTLSNLFCLYELCFVLHVQSVGSSPLISKLYAQAFIFDYFTDLCLTFVS